MMSESGSRPSHQPSVSARLLCLQELAQSSQWAQVLETLKDVEESRCLPAVVERGMQEAQWECVTSMATYCSVQQREMVVQQAASQNQWQCVTDIVKMGVDATVRSGLLKQAVAGRQMECAAWLIRLGVDRQDRDDSLRQAVEDGDCDFVLGLLDTCRDSDLRDFMLKEGLKKSWWLLVSGLVKQGLSVGQMESVCHEAVECRQWDLVLLLLKQGVSASERIVNVLFENNMAQSLLDCFPKGLLPDDLKSLLLMAGVRHGQGDITVQIIKDENVSDTELMESMKYAVNLRYPSALIKLIRKFPRSRRIFKQKFHQLDWVDSFQVCDTVDWIFNVLCIEKEHDLALHVATTNKKKVYLIHDYWRRYPLLFNLKKLKFRHALRQAYKFDRRVYKELVLAIYEKYVAYHPFLFRQAIRLRESSLIMPFCKLGPVGCTGTKMYPVLRFAVRWLVVYNDTSTLNCICTSKSINESLRIRLRKQAAKRAFIEYFKNQSEKRLITFIFFFSRSDKVYRSCLFKSAVTKAVQKDDGKCFVKILDCVLDEFSETYDSNSNDKKDLAFAYLKAIRKKRKHFIAQICQQSLSVMFYSLKDLIAITKIIFKTKSWDVLPCLSDGMRNLQVHGEDVYKPLNLCLQKMLKDRKVWSAVAHALEHWIKTVDYGNLEDLLKGIRDSILQKHLPSSMSRVAQWSLEKHFFNLAFVLALVIDDWSLVEAVLNVENLALREQFHCAAVNLAIRRGFIAISAAMLKILPLTSYSVKSILPPVIDAEPLVNSCKNLGLTEWAFLISVSFRKHPSVKEMLKACSSQAVLNHFLIEAVDCENWSVIEGLMNHCDEKPVLEAILRLAFKHDNEEIAEALIGRVDASRVYRARYVSETLLWMAVEVENVNLVRLCIAYGLSTFQRDVVFVEDTEKLENNCPLWFALWSSLIAIIKLLIKSGASTYRRLHAIRCEMIKYNFESSLDKDVELKEGYGHILSAASTPFRLEHMARLVVSHLIGCQPGRADRIERLPVPTGIKSLVNFRDVLDDDDDEQVPAE